MPIKYFFALIILSLALPVNAQKFKLSGTVVDEHGRAMPNVNVSIAGTRLHVQTNDIGSFVFLQLHGRTTRLEFTMLGFANQTVTVELEKDTDLGLVKMQGDFKMLNAVTIHEKLGETRKKQESLNIETVNAAYIKRNLGGSLMKSLERLPGIKTIGIGSGQSKPLIRGLGFNRVVVIENGIKHEGQQWGADHGLEIDQFAAMRITLIKGAVSFIYGSDAIAGAIDIKSDVLPKTHSLTAGVDLVAKSNNGFYGTSINLLGRNNKWFFEARATLLRYGDYRVPTDTVHVYNYPVQLYKNQVKNTAGRENNLHFSTGFVDGKTSSVFNISNTYSRSGFFANAHGLEPRRVDEALHDAASRDILLPSQEVNHFKLINRTKFGLGLHRLAIELGYQHNFRQEFSQYVNHGYMPPIYPTDLGIPQDLEREFDKAVYSVNLKDQFNIKNHEFTVGFNIEQQVNGINGWSFLVPAFKQRTAGAFLYDKLELDPNLYLHAALRYDHGRINIDPYTDWFSTDVKVEAGNAPVRLNRAEALGRRFDSFIWSAGLNYNLEHFVLKANIGKSFRMPIAKELAANGVNYHYFSYEKGDPTLNPEQSYQADLSFGWNTANWSIQLSPFYNYFPNYIYLNPTAAHDYFYGAGNQVFQYAQSKVMRYGAELQFKYHFSKNLSTEVLGEYLYAKQLSGDKKGYTLPFSPPPSVLFNFTYSPQLGKALSDTYFGLDYRLTAKQHHIVPPEKKTAGNQVFNLSLGTTIAAKHQVVTINLQAQNLFNVKYLNHTSFYRLIELPESGRNFILAVKLPLMLSKHE